MHQSTELININLLPGKQKSEALIISIDYALSGMAYDFFHGC
jgi:hypothetical protein